jgi:RNA polymerase sigma factor (sigma-70 family)
MESQPVAIGLINRTVGECERRQSSPGIKITPKSFGMDRRMMITNKYQEREVSFEVLAKRISPTLKRITHKLNGHYTFFDDEDLYQEALMHLWIDFGEGSLNDKTDSYILQGCYYHLKNYIRKTQDNVTLLSLTAPMGEDGRNMEESLPSDETSLFEYLDGKLQLEMAEQKYLTGREKEVLSLLMDGMSMREVGSRLGISHVMVLKIRNRIKEKYGRFAAITH